jgi:SAM-dependent methyltransferase
MLKTAKKFVRQIQRFIQRSFARTIDHLYQESPYNKLMIELEKKEDYSKYIDQIEFREAFEKKVLSNNPAYIRWFGKLYHFNRYKNLFSLREACTDYTGLNSRMRFSVEILKRYFANAKSVYLTEDGTLYQQLVASQLQYNLITSIYKHGDALHQDLTNLTFRDNSFDLCMSFEDIEHIPDYKAAIKELHRVTKPGGHVLLSAPFYMDHDKTIVRATIDENRTVTYLLTPEYHGDPVIPQGILCFYHFGWDLLDEFRSAGFKSVKVLIGYDIDKFILGTLPFIVAEK